MAEESATRVNAVSVKVPAFWPDEPDLWFTQLEGQFSIANITADATKYTYVIANLEHKYLCDIKDIIRNPPQTGKYDKIKTQLINRYSVSTEKRIKILLTQDEMGERKPSHYLQYLKNLAGPDVPDNVVRSIWTSRLPTHVQIAIAGNPKTDLDYLAGIADAVNDVPLQNVHQLSAPTMRSEPSSSTSDIADLKSHIAELSRKVDALSVSRSRPPFQSRYRQRPRSRSRSYDEEDQSICWYHRKYGNRATKCRPPCSYAENARGGR